MIKAKLLEKNEHEQIEKKFDVYVIEEVEATTAKIEFVDSGCQMLVDMRDLEIDDLDRVFLVRERMIKENFQEQKLRMSDLESELEEMKERRKQIYKEMGREYYDIDVADVLEYTKQELKSVEVGAFYTGYNFGIEHGLELIVDYIESYKVEENKQC